MWGGDITPNNAPCARHHRQCVYTHQLSSTSPINSSNDWCPATEYPKYESFLPCLTIGNLVSKLKLHVRWTASFIVKTSNTAAHGAIVASQTTGDGSSYVNSNQCRRALPEYHLPPRSTPPSVEPRRRTGGGLFHRCHLRGRSRSGKSRLRSNGRTAHQEQTAKITMGKK